MKDQSGIFEEFSRLFSTQRISTYTNHEACRDKLDVLAAYSWNIQLSQALYPALQILEIILRNAIHGAISLKYQSEYWFEEILHAKEQKVIESTKNNLMRQGKRTNADAIIAELSFGFWTSLFDIRYEHNQILWPHLLQPIFLYIPRKYRTRRYLSKQLHRIRHLRNRVFHHEPIWHWQDLVAQHDDLYRLLEWLSPHAHAYALIHDQFKKIYEQKWAFNRKLIAERFEIN